MITGFQRKNRKSTVAIPIENSDNLTASQMTKIIHWAMQNDNALNTISDAFDGAVTTGMNLLSVWMDYRNDPINGDIKLDNVSYNGYLIDPFFKKSDLSDCNFIWTRKWLTKPQIMSLLPDRKGDIENLYARGNRDGKFQFMPEAYNYGMENLLTYDEYWYRDYRKQKMLVDVRTGETLEWKGNEEDLNRFMSQNPEITIIDSMVQTCKLAIVVQGMVMYHGMNPMGIDKYPFVPVMGYYEPQIPYFPWRVQGIVRGLRDSQFLYNRRKVIELDILESQINSGFKFKENALVNPKDIYLQGQGKGIALKDEAQMTDVEQIQAPQIPPSMIELSKILGEEIQQISGVNEELLGSAQDDKAGVLSMLRQGAGLTTLQGLFDNLDNSQKLLGDIYLDLIQASFSPGKVQRIINEKPTLQFYSKAFGKYDTTVEEGLNTSTQRQMYFAQLLQLRETGIQVPIKELINASTFQNKDELVKAIQEEEKQQGEAQNQQMQMQMKLLQAQIEDLQSRAVANQGLGHERMARISENANLAIERRSQAIENISDARLNRAKTLKELESLDLEQLQQLFAMYQMIKPQDEDLPQEVKTQAIGPTAGSATPQTLGV